MQSLPHLLYRYLPTVKTDRSAHFTNIFFTKVVKSSPVAPKIKGREGIGNEGIIIFGLILFTLVFCTTSVYMSTFMLLVLHLLPVK